MGRFASIDFGLARLGVAVSDERRVIASAHAIVKAGKTSEETAREIAKSLGVYDLDLIVVGLPLHLNGKVGFLADEVKHFITHLEKVMSCKIVTWDERLSTAMAERTLREAQMSRKKRSKVIDAVTAVILLQNYLDSLPQNSYL